MNVTYFAKHSPGRYSVIALDSCIAVVCFDRGTGACTSLVVLIQLESVVNMKSESQFE